MEVSKQFTLAVLLPDNKLSNQVQFLRSKFENSATFSRWPPHLNLLYPFLTLSLESSEQQVKLLDDLSTICSNFKPIRLRLNRLGVFQRETGASTIFLEPQGNSKSTDAKYDEDCRCAPDSESDVNGFQSLCELQSLLELAVSRFVDISKKRKFHPHMTIGSAVSKVLDESRKVIKETLSILDPTDFDIVIDTIYIMSKNYMVHENVPEDRFYIVSELPLSRKLNYIPSILPSSSFNQPSLSAELLKRKRQTPDIKPKKHINEFESESFQTSESQATFYDRSLLTFNIKLLTYNILYSSKDFSVSDSDSEISSKDEIRFQYILEMLENSEADIIVLQEYTEIFEKYLAKSNLLTSGAYVSSGYQKDLAYGSTVMLSRLPFSQTNEYLRLPISPGKEAVFTEFVLSGLKYDGNSETAIIRVAGVHLTSDYSGNKHAKRTEQIQNVNQILSQPDLFSKSEVKSTNMPVISVIIGDLNDEGDEVIPQGFVDITRSSGPTFDALCNPYALATAQKKNDRGYRLDRVLLRTSALIGSDDPYLGKNRFCWWRVETNLLGNGISGKIASDHFALSTKLQFAVLKAKEEEIFADHDQALVEIVVEKEVLDEFPEMKLNHSKISDEELVNFLENSLDKPKNTLNHSDALTSVRNYLKNIFSQYNTMTVHYVVPVGSYAIGTHMDSDSDLDILCAGVIRWNHFVQILSEYNSSDIPSNANIRLLRVLDAARVPIIELMVDGVEVDLHYAWIPDLTSIYLDFQNQNKSFHPTLPEVAEYAWRDYVDLLLITFYRGFVNGESITDTELLKQSEKFITSLPAPSFIPLANRLDILILLDLFPSSPIDNRVSIHSFQLARKILRYWGMRRGVFGQRFGFIGGYTLSVLCAKVCKVLEVKLKISGEKKKITAVDIVFGFFELYSNWNWSEKSVEIFSKQSEDRKLTLPMTVFQMSPLNPLQPHVRGNAARTATAVAVAVWVDELKRSCQICAGSSLPTSKEFWNELWDPYPFIERHPFFIRIDISSSTQSTYRSIYSSLESRFLIAMLLLISQKLPGTTARLWPHRLSSNEKSDNFEGFYIIGLGKGESVQAENQKQWETVIVQICETFRYQIQSTIGDQNGAVILYLTNRQSLSIEFPNISNLQSLHDLIELDDSVDHQKFWELKKQRESHKINLGSEFGSDKGGKEVLKGKGNLRSSQDVYNRIVWDSNLDANEFLIGYEDRFTGIQEIPLKVFQQNRNIGADGNNDWIPFHRVWYFKQNSTLVWDRKTGVDLIFKK